MFNSLAVAETGNGEEIKIFQFFGMVSCQHIFLPLI